MKTDIKSLTFEQLNNEVRRLSLPSFRTKQIYKWLHESGASSFDEMSNISKQLREKLSDNYFCPKAH